VLYVSPTIEDTESVRVRKIYALAVSEIGSTLTIGYIRGIRGCASPRGGLRGLLAAVAS